MKITRKQLRKLINETMIKPGIPNIPSVDALGKIDNMARSEDLRADADSLAGAFGYPEDRSYSADLRSYDDVGRLGAEIDNMHQLGKDFAESFEHDDPFDIGAGEGHYFRRHALRKANEICDSFDMSMVRPLIDAFTEGANDYIKTVGARYKRKLRLYNPVDMARTIHSKYEALYNND